MQVKRRKCKKAPTAERKHLGRPDAANQVCLMDFVFNSTAEERVIKNMTVVDDATHEAVAILPECAIGWQSLTRISDRPDRIRQYGRRALLSASGAGAFNILE